MLTELSISNFAIIENQSVPFGPGLNVISGETGSGKSIILNALELILGGRSSTQSIRSGAEAMEVQAHFDLSSVSPSVIESLPDIAKAEELVVVRTLNTQGKGKVYINGNLGTVSLLNEISNKLIHVCSQNSQVRLLDPQFHLELLDEFLGLGARILSYREKFELYRGKNSELSAFEDRLRRKEERRTELELTIEELGGLELHSSLREELEAKAKRLGNVQKLSEASEELLGILNGDDGVFTGLHGAVQRAQEVQRIDPEAERIFSPLFSAKTELEEFEREVSRYISQLQFDDETFTSVSERLAELARLERKYRRDTPGLMNLFEDSKRELSAIESPEALNSLKREVDTLFTELKQEAFELSKIRGDGAKKLSRVVERELAELNMKDATLSMAFERVDLNPRGQDRLEFLISANKGEPARPLRQVASGGELSRIMLVLKKILRDRSGVNVLVFDEVDAGISGGVARAVGEKLYELSKDSQVVCITHLAQVASFADKHLLVGKKGGKRTVSVIHELSDDEKVDEIARMLAGYTITAASRESARELLSSKDR